MTSTMNQKDSQDQMVLAQVQSPLVNNIGAALIAKMEEKRKYRERNRSAIMASPAQRMENKSSRLEANPSNEVMMTLQEEILALKSQHQEDAQIMKDILQEVMKLRNSLEKKDSNTETVSPEAMNFEDISQKRSATDFAEPDRQEVKRVRVETLEEGDRTEIAATCGSSKTIPQSEVLPPPSKSTAMPITLHTPRPVAPSSNQTILTAPQKENPAKSKIEALGGEKVEKIVGSQPSSPTLPRIESITQPVATQPTQLLTSAATPTALPAASAPGPFLPRKLRSDTAENTVHSAERVQRQSSESVASAEIPKTETLPPNGAQLSAEAIGESTREEEPTSTRRVILNQRIDRRAAKVGHINKSKLSISYRIELNKGSGPEIQTCTKNFPGPHHSFDWTSKSEINTLNEWRQKVISENCPIQSTGRWLESEISVIQEILQDQTRTPTQMTILGITKTYNEKMKNVTQQIGEKGAEGDFVLKQNRKAPIRSRAAISHWLVKVSWQSQIVKKNGQEDNQDQSHEDHDSDMEGEDNQGQSHGYRGVNGEGEDEVEGEVGEE